MVGFVQHRGSPLAGYAGELHRALDEQVLGRAHSIRRGTKLAGFRV